jgi:methylthioribose-1-phosphate isomerase
MRVKAIDWQGDRVRILDQRKLPGKMVFLECRTGEAVAEAICSMAVRGAPAIGIAAAMGIALEAKRSRGPSVEGLVAKLNGLCDRMGRTRPTAVNLFWAIDRMRKRLQEAAPKGAGEIRTGLEREALRIFEEDLKVNRRIGAWGKELIADGAGVLTHCNAGALATAGYGTALGVIRAAWAEGKRFRVFADETRPLLQGVRLTAWELVREGIGVTVLSDNMAGWLMARGEVDLVLVGADRIARNGDTANKIGTFSLAVLAHFHRIPFYVAAPTSTLDPALASGEEIPIEDRDSREVTHFAGKGVAPKGVKVFNPAFDVTPHRLIDGIVTEKGIARKPFARHLRRIHSAEISEK